jgi:hypothetical protein
MLCGVMLCDRYVVPRATVLPAILCSPFAGIPGVVLAYLFGSARLGIGKNATIGKQDDVIPSSDPCEQ